MKTLLIEAFFLFLASGVAVLYFARKSSLSELGFRCIRQGSLNRIGFALPLFLIALSTMMGGVTTVQTGGILANLALALAAAFNEEIYFRGIICRICMPKGKKAAILVSSVIFALAHTLNLLRGAELTYTLLQIAFAFFYGVVLALIYLISDSLWTGIFLHFFHDACALHGMDLEHTGFVVAVWIVILICYTGMLICKKYRKWIFPLLVLSMLLCIGVWLKTWLFPPCELPAPTGTYTVETELYTWVDEGRVDPYSKEGEYRKLTARIWYPEEEGVYPLVVFSHGALGVIDSNFSTCRDLASHGYVVASVGHPYQAMYVEDVNGQKTYVDGSFMKNVMNQEETEQELYENSVQWMQVRTDDLQFVLDKLLELSNREQRPFSMIDREKIGAFGHSLGGAAAVEMGRIRDDIIAVIDLEGTMLGEYSRFENGRITYDSTPYPIPVLDVNGGRVVEMMEGTRKERPDFVYVNDYLGERATAYKKVIFQEAGHLNYTDLPLVSPPLARLLGVGQVDPRSCVMDVNRIVCIYFDYYLKGTGSLEEIRDIY